MLPTGYHLDSNGQLVDDGGTPYPTQGGTTPAQLFGNGTTGAPAPTDPSLQNTMQNKLAEGVGNITGGNTNQVQGGFQNGQFASDGTQQQQQTTQQATNQTGSTAQQSTQAGTQDQLGFQTGQTAGQTVGQTQDTSQGQTMGSTQGTSTGQTVGQNTGTSAQQGTTTTGVNDTLGFGNLLKNQAGAATATDANRQGYLTDLMNTGGSAFQGQVQQAVNNSLSGPGMQGVGDSAQSRAAGYAAADVARTNQDQRLAAASQLAGPSATTTLAGAANPYLGTTQQSANTGQTSDTQNQNTTQNTNQNTAQNTNNVSNQNTAQNTAQQSSGTSGSTGTSSQVGNTTGQSTSSQLSSTLSDLLAKNSSSGTSAASNLQSAYGNTPQQTSSGGGGGSVICTVLGERGWIPHWILVAELSHVQNNWKQFRRAAKGYLFWGVPVAKLARKSRLLSYMLLPMAKWCSYEATRRAQICSCVRMPFFVIPWLAYHVFLKSNDFLGRFIPGKPMVKDPEIAALLSRSGLELNILEK